MQTWGNDEASSSEPLVPLHDRKTRFSMQLEDESNSWRQSGVESGEFDSEGAASCFKILQLVLLILIWYAMSTGIILYNKWLLTRYNFHYPVTVTLCSMILKFLWSSLVVRLGLGRNCLGVRPYSFKSWWTYSICVIPLGVTTALDIVMANSSFLFLSVSMYTIVKASSPLWQLLFSMFVFRLETVCTELILTLVVISLGLMLATSDDLQFLYMGLALAVGSSIMSGVRCCLVQMRLQGQNGIPPLHPISLIWYLSPWATVAIFPVWVWREAESLYRSEFVQSPNLRLQTVAMVCGACTVIFVMVLVEFAIVQRTSALSISVAGVLKEGLTLATGAMVFHDQVTTRNILGLIICILGVKYYNWFKYKQSQRPKRRADMF